MNLSPLGPALIGVTQEQAKTIAQVVVAESGQFPWWARLMLVFAFAWSLVDWLDKLGAFGWLAKRLTPMIKTTNPVLELGDRLGNCLPAPDDKPPKD